MWQVALFLAGSLAVFRLSWRSLADRRTHGFYRFFAFESLLALILLNAPEWFQDSASARQIVAYSLGAISIGLAADGFRLLRFVGKPSAAAAEKTNLGFENTTALVEVGSYRFIRHPLYASLLALAWSAYLKAPARITGACLAVGATVFLLATAMHEERENVRRFGSAYQAYMRRTRRFVPFLF